MQQLIPSVQRKIELRQSEIKHQMNYLRSLQKMEKIKDQSKNSYIMFYN